MKKFSYLVLVLAVLCSAPLNAQKVNEKPKLVVGIVVDQMRHEYLTRFYDNFGEGGFKRLMDEGFMAKNGQYNYAYTLTGPGHTSIYTGTSPSVHGIVANDWYSRALQRSVYCAEDTTVSAVGGTEKNGHISPKNLYSSTITDELKLSTQRMGKVIAMSIKDRGAALPGGHLSDGSYWYDSSTGEFMTSTYYMKDLPDWVKKFNADKHADKYLNMTWDTFLPIEKYTMSGSDDSKYESGFRGKDTPTFPYDLKQLRKGNGNFSMLSSTPFGNSILAELAISALDAENLGQDAIPDFLAVSFSSTDYVGHNFGPQSKEVEDTYIRLDRELAKLFKTLDEKVGEGQYTVFLSADHAVAENSLRMKDERFRVDNLSRSSARKNVTAALSAKYGEKDWITSFSANIYLNRELIASEGINLNEMQNFVADRMMEQEGVYLALTAHDLITNDYTKKIKNLMQNSFHTKESGDVLVVMDPAWQTGGSKGTSHGNPWSYDTHVPILLYGWGIKQGSSVREIHTIDIASTISMLLNIRLPNGTTGQPIAEAIK